MEIVQINIDKLIPFSGNPNELDEYREAALNAAVAEEFRDPIEVCSITREFPEWERLGKKKGFYLVVDGHHRLEALRRAGAQEAPCIIFAYNPRQAKLRSLQSNNLRGNLIPVLTARLLVELLDSGFEPEELSRIVGFPRGEMDALLKLLDEPPPQEGEGMRDTEPPPAFESIEIAVLPDQKELIMAAIDKAAASIENEPIRDAFKAALEAIDVAHGADKFAMFLWHAMGHVNDLLKKKEIVLSGKQANKFKAAMQKAEQISGAENAGRCLELICAEFMSTPEESLR